MQITIIVAIAKNNAIGKNNQLLWHLPADMKFFKDTTEHHPILTGRKNYFSIPEKFRPLKNRTNIVVTRNTSISLEEGVVVVSSIDEGIKYAQNLGEKELFIIGGGEIYAQSMALAHKLIVTEVNALFEDADTFFPEIDQSKWHETSRKAYLKDEKNKFNFDIVTYERNRI